MVADKEAETDWVSSYMRGYWTGRDHCFTDATREGKSGTGRQAGECESTGMANVFHCKVTMSYTSGTMYCTLKYLEQSAKQILKTLIYRTNHLQNL